LSNKDYVQFHSLISKVEGLLESSHLESMARDFALEGFEDADGRTQRLRVNFACKALRVSVLQMLLGNPSYRELSRTIASSDLLADFCRARQIDGIRGISKSTLERATKFFGGEQVRWMSQVLTEMSGQADRAAQLGLHTAIETAQCLVDTTCLEANIHYPSDWVLLGDVTRTLLKATKLIRAAGLKHRMPCEPEGFARQMNRLCIEMTHSRRHPDARRKRKRVLRSMKKLLRCIGAHARRHADLLSREYEQTDYTLVESEHIVGRINRMLDLLPTVIWQAHERIIAGRLVASSRKILSVYEPQVQVLVRGKAGHEVEFGNTFFVAESPQGMIVDWELYGGKAPPEWRQLQQSLDRQNDFDLPEPIKAACADRGFCSKKGSARLSHRQVYDAVCPRDPAQLHRRMDEPRFRALQRRRGSTEARIAILKQRQSNRVRSKGFEHRYLAVAWGVLRHNLRIIARMLAQQDQNTLAA
jgi:IS5 family transposase